MAACTTSNWSQLKLIQLSFHWTVIHLYACLVNHVKYNVNSSCYFPFYFWGSMKRTKNLNFFWLQMNLFLIPTIPNHFNLASNELWPTNFSVKITVFLLHRTADRSSATIYKKAKHYIDAVLNCKIEWKFRYFLFVFILFS